MKNLNEALAFSKKSPYDIYQEWEGIPAYKDFIVPDLLELELGEWERTGGKAAFVNMEGGAQIEYEDQDPEIHKIFVRECKTRGAETRMPMFGT